jgi:hypothetical protein
MNLSWLWLVPLGVTSGCALHYYDEKSGTEHVWGIGHLKMKAAPVAGTNVEAVISGASLLGVGVGLGREDFYLTAGWDYRRRVVLGSNAALALEWPGADFFNLRVGTNPPFLTPGYRYSVQTNR